MLRGVFQCGRLVILHRKMYANGELNNNINLSTKHLFSKNDLPMYIQDSFYMY